MAKKVLHQERNSRNPRKKHFKNQKCSIQNVRKKSSPDNVILYYRLTPSSSITADDTVHMRKVTIQISHYHKKKLDSIEELMLSNFMCEPSQLNLKQPDTDYLLTTYRIEVFTSGKWQR